jgi:hypothetical protein
MLFYGTKILIIELQKIYMTKIFIANICPAEIFAECIDRGILVNPHINFWNRKSIRPFYEHFSFFEIFHISMINNVDTQWIGAKITILVYEMFIFDEDRRKSYIQR